MGAAAAARLGLVVRSHCWHLRAARTDLDLALAAAAMDFSLEVYFLGPALLQLAADRDSERAMLPAGYRAWAALPELAEVVVYAERDWLEFCRRSAIRLLLPVQGLDAEALRAGWRQCRHVLVV
jgi:sulfur relay (sulfurtransferase) DsrF/TusC family protein